MQFQPTPPSPLTLILPALVAIGFGAVAALAFLDQLRPLLAAFVPAGAR